MLQGQDQSRRRRRRLCRFRRGGTTLGRLSTADADLPSLSYEHLVSDSTGPGGTEGAHGARRHFTPEFIAAPASHRPDVASTRAAAAPTAVALPVADEAVGQSSEGRPV